MTLAFEVTGSKGTIAVDHERMNELQLYTTGQTPAAGFKTILAGPEHALQILLPGLGHQLGFNDVKTIDARVARRARRRTESEPGFRKAPSSRTAMRSSPMRRSLAQAPRAAARNIEDASTISRIGHSRGRPVVQGFGKCGAITRHSASVRSVWYRVTMRLCCCRVVGVHMANPRLVRESLGITAATMTQPFSKSAANKSRGGIELGHRQLAPRDRPRPICRDVPRQRHRHRAAGPVDQRRSQGHRRRVVRPSQEAAGSDCGAGRCRSGVAGACVVRPEAQTPPSAAKSR